MADKIKLTDLLAEAGISSHKNGTVWRTKVKGPASTSEETGPWTNADKFAGKNKQGWTRYFESLESATSWSKTNEAQTIKE